MKLPSADHRRKRILVADDDETQLAVYRLLIGQLGYDVIEARNGDEVVEKALQHLPDLIITDIMMPGKDGFEVTRILKERAETKHIPLIIVTSMDSKDDILKGISLGADDYLTKPVNLQELSLRIRNNLEMKAFHDLLQNYNAELGEQVRKRTAELKEAFEKLDDAYGRIRHEHLEVIHRLSLVAEYKDEDTGKHIKRISLYTDVLSRELGMDHLFRDTLYYASPMHDIGKVGVPDSILLKQGPLDRQEWENMKTHTLIGAKILSGSDSPFLVMARDIALSHHERWDGTGYPAGLREGDIPLVARIVCIVDQYDALRSNRPYKPPFDHEKAFQIISSGDGRTLPGHFDPGVLEAFRNVHEKFRDVFESNKG
jgi:putative two-component system response regulator